MRMLNAPQEWLVHLHDGSVVRVWADAAEGIAGEEDQRDYRFVNLIDADVADQENFEVLGRTPSNDQRVMVTVAHFPRSAVASVS